MNLKKLKQIYKAKGMRGALKAVKNSNKVPLVSKATHQQNNNVLILRKKSALASYSILEKIGETIVIPPVIPPDYTASSNAVITGPSDPSSDPGANHTYTMEINGVEISYTDDGTPTTQEVVDGLKAAINAEPLISSDVIATTSTTQVIIQTQGDATELTLDSVDSSLTVVIDGDLPVLPGVENWISNYNGVWLHLLDETSGDIAYDESTNNFDLNISGTPAWQYANPVFGSDLPVDFDAFNVGGSASSGPSLDSSGYSFVASHRSSLSSSTDVTFFDVSGSAKRISFGIDSSRQLQAIHDDGTWDPLVLIQGVGERFFWGVTADTASLKLYQNGLHFATRVHTGSSITSPTVGLGTQFDGSARFSKGQYGIFGAFNQEINSSSMHQMAIDISAAPSGGHWYKNEVIDYGIDTNVEVHLPLWNDADKTYFINVSGLENHAQTSVVYNTLTSSLEVGAMAGVGLSSAGYIRASSSIDGAGHDWTLRVTWRPTQLMENYVSIFGKGTINTNRICAFAYSDGRVAYQFYDGSNNNFVILPAGTAVLETTYCWVFRYTHSGRACDWWLNGTKQTGFTTSHTKVNNEFWNFGKTALAGIRGRDISLPTVWTEALSDAHCARLSTFTAP